MKEILGYGIFCLIGLFCIYCMALRMESLDNRNLCNINNTKYIQNEKNS